MAEVRRLRVSWRQLERLHEGLVYFESMGYCGLAAVQRAAVYAGLPIGLDAFGEYELRVDPHLEEPRDG